MLSRAFRVALQKSGTRFFSFHQLTRYKSEVHTFSPLTVLPSKPLVRHRRPRFTVTKVKYALFLFSPSCPSVFVAGDLHPTHVKGNCRARQNESHSSSVYP